MVYVADSEVVNNIFQFLTSLEFNQKLVNSEAIHSLLPVILNPFGKNSCISSSIANSQSQAWSQGIEIPEERTAC